jgi:hypothetical protein
MHLHDRHGLHITLLSGLKQAAQSRSKVAVTRAAEAFSYSL